MRTKGAAAVNPRRVVAGVAFFAVVGVVASSAAFVRFDLGAVTLEPGETARIHVLNGERGRRDRRAGLQIGRAHV